MKLSKQLKGDDRKLRELGGIREGGGDSRSDKLRLQRPRRPKKAGGSKAVVTVATPTIA